jgi:hypothetical protein
MMRGRLQKFSGEAGETVVPIRVSFVNSLNKTTFSGQTKPYRDHSACSFLAQTSGRYRSWSKSSPVNSQKVTSGVSQPILLFGVAGALFSVVGGAVESEGMKSCPEPRIEVIVEAHEPFLGKGGTALDLDVQDGKIGLSRFGES